MKVTIKPEFSPPYDIEVSEGATEVPLISFGNGERKYAIWDIDTEKMRPVSKSYIEQHHPYAL